MTPRSHRRLIVAWFVYVLALFAIPAPARAEDIDIFQINPALSSLRPNVLIILDTSANWSATDTVGGGSRYQNVRRELRTTIDGLSSQFNVGLMMFAETGGGNDSVDGGVVRAALRQMTGPTESPAGTKQKYVDFFSTVDGNFDKTNNTSMGLAFAEAYYYFTGQAAVSGVGKVKRDYGVNVLPTTGNQADNNLTLAQSNAIWATAGNAFTSAGSRTYVRPIVDACQKNFIIYIANGVVNDTQANNADATTKLAAAGGDTTTITFTEDDGNQDNISDEWTRFLANADLLPDATNPSFPGKQTITTYTVEVNRLTNLQGRANTKLLQSMATQGKGKYFSVTSAATAPAGTETISSALNKIFAEVQAVNSVFASSTLPVSVNVRGTFLNQVYMGVFRPDANSSPRWPGNVKQYTLAATPSGNLVLVDKLGNPVENPATGFVSPSTQSFWTHDPIAPLTGFWDLTYYPDAKAQAPLVPTTSDLPDGEFVEKGGAGQHLRDDYRTSLVPRKLFTCITAAGCTPGTTLDSSHLFNDSNAFITEALLGISPPLAVTLSRSGTGTTDTVTAVGTAHGYSTGQAVTIFGASSSNYNGTYTVTRIDGNRFTFTLSLAPSSPATTASGMTAAKGAGTAVAITGMVRSGTTVTVTTAGPHTFLDNAQIYISGVTPSDYTGSKTIFGSNPIGGTFQFTVPDTPASPATTVGAAQRTAPTTSGSKTIASVTRSGTTVTVNTQANHTFSNGDTVTISGVVPAEYNGSYVISGASGKVFNYTITLGPAAPVVGAGASADPATFVAVTSITRSGTTATVVTASNPTLLAPSPFANGNAITIAGANETEYNGTFTIGGISSTGFTYTVPINPATSATASAVAAGAINKVSLINWVRGENRQLEDNPDSSALTNVRGYLHGDVLHSRPAVVNYNRTGQPVDRDVFVYYGSNEGIIHAVKGGQDNADGDERWGFVPTEFYSRFGRLYSASPIISAANPRTYFADGPLSVDAVYVNDRIEGAGARAQLYVGMRRGGRFYYSLDVTNPDVPVYKWKIDNSTTGFEELGQSWSEPKVVKINVAYPPATPAAERKVIVFGAGYDAPANDAVPQGTATMGRGIFVVDATSGALIWHAHSSSRTPGLAANARFKSVSGMDYAIAADLAVINSTRDVNDYADRIYAADTGGNIWRVNMGDTDPANWTVRQVAALSGSAASQKRRFLFAPDVVQFDSNWDSILVGSGDREQPFDITIANRYYMIKDAHAVNDDASLPVVTDSGDTDVFATSTNPTALCDLTSNALQGTDTVAAQVDETCLAASRGWKIRLGTGEKTVTGSTTLGGTTIFATNTPASQATPGQCTGSLGLALIYAVDFKDATAKIDYSGTGVLGARATTRPGGGFPPTPVPVSIKIGDKFYEGAITGTQVVNPPGAAIGQRFRVFWNLNVDN